jgi:hypothetical protein
MQRNGWQRTRKRGRMVSHLARASAVMAFAVLVGVGAAPGEQGPKPVARAGGLWEPEWSPVLPLPGAVLQPLVSERATLMDPFTIP